MIDYEVVLNTSNCCEKGSDCCQAFYEIVIFSSNVLDRAIIGDLILSVPIKYETQNVISDFFGFPIFEIRTRTKEHVKSIAKLLIRWGKQRIKRLESKTIDAKTYNADFLLKEEEKLFDYKYNEITIN